MPLVNAHTLDNGCRVFFRPTPGKRILAIVLNIAWGGRDDPAELAGRSKLMSSLLTKGTERRSAYQIAYEMENVGGSIESYCTPDVVGLEAQVEETDWPLALDIMGDCLLHPVFDANEFEKEKTLLRAQLNRMEDQKFPFSYKHFLELFYENHPYAVPASGDVETLDAITPDMPGSMHSAVVRPDRCVISVVGNVPEAEFLECLEKIWAGYQQSEKPLDRCDTTALPGHGLGKLREVKRDFEQGMVLMGYRFPLPGDPHTAPARMVSGILGEGMASRLFVELREKAHLAYSVGCSYVPRQIGAHCLLHIGTGPDTVDQARDAMEAEARGLLKNPPDEAEIERARQYILGKHLISRQTNIALAHSISNSETLGLGWEYSENYPDRIQAVTADDIQKLAADHLQDPAILILRPSRNSQAQEA
ncbi:MAG: M16 family metallopeptidase [Candidatus Sumerlaeia bacterium]